MPSRESSGSTLELHRIAGHSCARKTEHTEHSHPLQLPTLGGRGEAWEGEEGTGVQRPEEVSNFTWYTPARTHLVTGGTPAIVRSSVWQFLCLSFNSNYLGLDGNLGK